MSLKSSNHCGGLRFYEVGYANGNGDGDQLIRVRQLWSVGSTSGGKYVSVKTGEMEDQSPLPVTANGESDSTADTVNIKFVKYTSENNPVETVQPWFYLKFSNGQEDYSVTATENGVTASDQTPNSGTIFRVFSLYSPNDSYIVLQANEKSGDDPLYPSSNGAGNMKLKVWNTPVPDPPRTSDEVDPALLFRLVRPLNEN